MADAKKSTIDIKNSTPMKNGLDSEGETDMSSPEPTKRHFDSLTKAERHYVFIQMSKSTSQTTSLYSSRYASEEKVQMNLAKVKRKVSF